MGESSPGLTAGAALTVTGTVEGDKAVLRTLTIGRTLGDDREVITGLSGGDRVVLAPADDLADGARVRIASDKDDADASNE